jgi:hypothetical protein
MPNLNGIGWDPVRQRGADGPGFASQAGFDLGAGVHTLVLRNRESGTRIDTLAIVREGLALDLERDLPPLP